MLVNLTNLPVVPTSCKGSLSLQVHIEKQNTLTSVKVTLHVQLGRSWMAKLGHSLVMADLKSISENDIVWMRKISKAEPSSDDGQSQEHLREWPHIFLS
jgi:hypothetical protein